MATQEAPDGILRTSGVAASVIGAVGSVALMYAVGTRGDRPIPTLLLACFVGWVAIPFVALLAADRKWREHPHVSSTVHLLAIVLMAATLAIYLNEWLTPPRPKPAAPFLMVPLISLAIIGVTLAVTVRRTAR